MGEILNRLLAILAIVVPLGLAYVLVKLQTHKQDQNRRKNATQQETITLGKKKRLGANKSLHGNNRYL